MHHLFVTPLVAGVVTAGIIALSPSFSDPHEMAYASEEPVLEQVTPKFAQSIKAPAELAVPEMPSRTIPAVSMSRTVRVAKLKIAAPDMLTDIAYTRSDMVLAAAPVSELKAVPLRASAELLQVAVTRMNLRAGPGTTFKKLGQLMSGTLLEQTGKAQGPWLEIAVLENGKTGWLHSKYLKAVQ